MRALPFAGGAAVDARLARAAKGRATRGSIFSRVTVDQRIAESRSPRESAPLKIVRSASSAPSRPAADSHPSPSAAFATRPTRTAEVLKSADTYVSQPTRNAARGPKALRA